MIGGQRIKPQVNALEWVVPLFCLYFALIFQREHVHNIYELSYDTDNLRQSLIPRKLTWCRFLELAKDPGVPNLFPYKDVLIQKALKQRDEREQQKQARSHP